MDGVRCQVFDVCPHSSFLDNLVEINMFYDNIFFYGACMMYFCIVKEGFPQPLPPTETLYKTEGM